ncbi:MAG: hypothetical protein UR34_C0011G0008 [candidate division WS6 bacterium GW2011_GWC1_33_20]|uniref:Uncharacterized protein n=1 Tax=candidate division WS6 bacterium GW2011_GWC1_33_20 TaxID=1619089 RepID=A0A0F9ZI00_9BACT|nr:MAG: hypothetical protein UR34_C0011G0008 [candidate division WS6 bacterium GW2011_GWC1_33_20]
MDSYESIVRKLECRISNLRGSENIDLEIAEILKLVYILKHCADKKKKAPVDAGGFLQLSLSL